MTGHDLVRYEELQQTMYREEVPDTEFHKMFSEREALEAKAKEQGLCFIEASVPNFAPRWVLCGNEDFRFGEGEYIP